MAKNDFDRILRENIHRMFVPYVEEKLNLEIVQSKPLPGKLTGTYESEVDFLVMATSRTGGQFLIHFEFQTNNDPKMLKRIKRYHGILFHKYGLPIQHFVIYLGQKEAKMRTKLDEKEVFKEFHLIEIAKVSLNEFLSASNPEEILLGILSDFGSQNVSEGIQRIINALKLTSKNETELQRYLKQLKILARIRKLDNVVHEIINDMPIILDIRDSHDYQMGMKEGIIEGEEKGKEAGRLEAVVQLALSGTISIDQAATVLGISVEKMNQHIEEVKKNPGS